MCWSARYAGVCVRACLCECVYVRVRFYVDLLIPQQLPSPVLNLVGLNRRNMQQCTNVKIPTTC